jgi:hypothetical protein
MEDTLCDASRGHGPAAYVLATVPKWQIWAILDDTPLTYNSTACDRYSHVSCMLKVIMSIQQVINTKLLCVELLTATHPHQDDQEVESTIDRSDFPLPAENMSLDWSQQILLLLA